MNSEPRRSGTGAEQRLAKLRAQAAAEPSDRKAQFELVRGLMDMGRLDEAKAAARSWRQSDAYNLVVVRLLGDIYSQLGETERAMRTYSAVVELLPEDHKAHRALTSDLPGNDVAAFVSEGATSFDGTFE